MATRLTVIASAMVTRVGAIKVVQRAWSMFSPPAQRPTWMCAVFGGRVKQSIFIVFTTWWTSSTVFQILVEFVMWVGGECMLGLIFDRIGCARSGTRKRAMLAEMYEIPY